MIGGVSKVVVEVEDQGGGGGPGRPQGGAADPPGPPGRESVRAVPALGHERSPAVAR